jgi:acyl-CoA synthetase (AMP-forming)/AMP-acid ligase II
MAPNWLGKTTYSVVETQARVFGDRIALVISDESAERLDTVTFRELHEGVLRTARQLAGTGVRPGAQVGIWADNSARWLESWFATSLLGAVTVALNPRLTPREIGGLIEATDVSHLLIGGGV